MDARDNDGNTPLHGAAREGQAETVALLLDRGADVNARDKDGGTPLHTAAVKGHTKAARIILNKGVDLNARDEDGHTPLYGPTRGYTEMAKLLKKHGGVE